eukprot:Skav205020  [mRNA]  locus=scaffold1026:272795:278391:- [translate_table: standard]
MGLARVDRQRRRSVLVVLAVALVLSLAPHPKDTGVLEKLKRLREEDALDSDNWVGISLVYKVTRYWRYKKTMADGEEDEYEATIETGQGLRSV